MRVTGKSIEPRIETGDMILADYAKEPRTGNIVIATINGAIVVKKFLRREARVILRSTKPRNADIEVKETGQFLSGRCRSPRSWKGRYRQGE